MKRKNKAILFYLLIALAVVGLFTQLFGNTRNFLMGIVMMLGFAVILFALLNFVINRSRGSSDEMKKYKQAVKQSKYKYQQNAPPVKPVQSSNLKRKAPTGRKLKRRPTHLRVIEGNKEKTKEKDRATF